MNLLSSLDRFFSGPAPLAAGERLLVAFSGGPDSTALLWGLRRLAERRDFEIHAAHLDHGLDPFSGERAQRAAGICRSLGLELETRHRPIAEERRRGESLEAAARRVRYRFLERRRRELGARYLATAHQRDDQIETVLLRLLWGSGLEGLAGIPARRGALVRPLLQLSRTRLADSLHESGLRPALDPGNRDLSVPRNRLRHLLLPRLVALDPELPERVLRLAAAAAGARRRTEDLLTAKLRPRATPAGGAALPIAGLLQLPGPLWTPALALLHRRAGLAYPPPSRAVSDLRRQLEAGAGVGCDCGGGWRWERRNEELLLRRAPRRSTGRPFAYTLRVPGEIEVPELEIRFRLARAPVEPWMFEGSARRTGLCLPLGPGDRVTIRSRRPGDRMRPLGCPYDRRLKEVLIDRGVPRAERDRLPLLCLGDRVAWIPGVTIDDGFRVRRGSQAWVAEIEAA